VLFTTCDAKGPRYDARRKAEPEAHQSSKSSSRMNRSAAGDINEAAVALPAPDLIETVS